MKIVQVLTGVVLLVTVAVLVTVLVLLYTMPKPPQQEACDMLCLPSTSISKGSDAHCGCSSVRLHKYLDEAIKIANRTHSENSKEESTQVPSPQLMSLIKRLPWNIKPAARVTGKKQPPPRQYDNEMFPVREWYEKDDKAFLRYGMEYRNGRLVVPVKGSYLIHSFLDLYETCKNTTSTVTQLSRRKRQTNFVRQKRNVHQDQKPNGIKHAIYRYNILNGTEEELINSEHPHEVSQNGYFNVYDSFLAAAVSLDAGDEVYVKISDLKLLAHPNSNYFGVSMI